MNLSTLLSNRRNGITQFRLILAFFVLFDHGYALNGQEHPNLGAFPISLSSLAVRLFIFLTGLLCFRSALRHNVFRYFTLRASRLLPGYWLCMLISGLIFLPLFFLMGFSDAQTWSQMLTDSLGYISRNLLLFQGEYVPQGWLSDFPIRALNGSLWTLQPEWMAYLVIFFLAPLFLRSLPMAIVAFDMFDLMSVLEPRLFMRILSGLLSGYGFEISTRSHLYLATYLLSGPPGFRKVVTPLISTPGGLRT